MKGKEKGIPVAWMVSKSEDAPSYRTLLDVVTRRVRGTPPAEAELGERPRPADAPTLPEWKPRRVVVDLALAEQNAVEASIVGREGTQVALCLFHLLSAWLHKVVTHTRRAKGSGEVKETVKELKASLDRMREEVQLIHTEKGLQLKEYSKGPKNKKALLKLRKEWVQLIREARGEPAWVPEGAEHDASLRQVRRSARLDEQPGKGKGTGRYRRLAGLQPGGARGRGKSNLDLWGELEDLVWGGVPGEGDAGRLERCQVFLAKVKKEEAGWNGVKEGLFSEYFDKEFMQTRKPSSWMVSARRERGCSDEDVTTTTSMIESYHRILKQSLFNSAKPSIRGRRLDWLVVQLAGNGEQEGVISAYKNQEDRAVVAEERRRAHADAPPVGAPQPAGWPAADTGVWADLPTMEDGEAEVARAAAAAEREERERGAGRTSLLQLVGRWDDAVYESEEWVLLRNRLTDVDRSWGDLERKRKVREGEGGDFVANGGQLSKKRRKSAQERARELRKKRTKRKIERANMNPGQPAPAAAAQRGRRGGAARVQEVVVVKPGVHLCTNCRQPGHNTRTCTNDAYLPAGVSQGRPHAGVGRGGGAAGQKPRTFGQVGGFVPNIGGGRSSSQGKLGPRGQAHALLKEARRQ